MTILTSTVIIFHSQVTQFDAFKPIILKHSKITIGDPNLKLFGFIILAALLFYAGLFAVSAFSGWEGPYMTRIGAIGAIVQFAMEMGKSIGCLLGSVLVYKHAIKDPT